MFEFAVIYVAITVFVGLGARVVDDSPNFDRSDYGEIIGGSLIWPIVMVVVIASGIYLIIRDVARLTKGWLS